jgi:hypothetical protein
MDTSTTNITDLPQESSDMNTASMSTPVTNGIDEGQIRQLVSGIQEASIKGATRLRSSDIPSDMLEIMTDAQTIPVTFPKIEQVDTTPIQSNISSNTDVGPNLTTYIVMNELKIPVLVGILSCIFHIPFVTSYVKTKCSWVYLTDGSVSLSGYIVFIVIVGIIFYILEMISRHVHCSIR